MTIDKIKEVIHLLDIEISDLSLKRTKEVCEHQETMTELQYGSAISNLKNTKINLEQSLVCYKNYLNDLQWINDTNKKK